MSGARHRDTPGKPKETPSTRHRDYLRFRVGRLCPGLNTKVVFSGEQSVTGRSVRVKSEQLPRPRPVTQSPLSCDGSLPDRPVVDPQM